MTAPRGRRMNRSRAIAAATSVGALVALTAGVAVANPGAHTSKPPTTASNSGGTQSTQNPSAGDDSSGGDSGWLAPDDDGFDPNSGWAPSQPGNGSGGFDPGAGGSSGSTRSGGS